MPTATELTPISELIEIPDWIDSDYFDLDDTDRTLRTLTAIAQKGCDTGAYLPACTYHEVLATMAEHGNDVLETLETWGELPEIPTGESWAGIACLFLSQAVESWAASALCDLDNEGYDVDSYRLL